MKTAIVTVLLAILAKVAADEAKEYMNWLPAKLIRWASKRFPPELQPRLQEEWLAHCNDLPGNIAKLWHALGCVCASLKLTPAVQSIILKLAFLPFTELGGLAFAIIAVVLELLRHRRLIALRLNDYPFRRWPLCDLDDLEFYTYDRDFYNQCHLFVHHAAACLPVKRPVAVSGMCHAANRYVRLLMKTTTIPQERALIVELRTSIKVLKYVGRFPNHTR